MFCNLMMNCYLLIKYSILSINITYNFGYKYKILKYKKINKF